jgi:hypothetical protein
MQRRDNIGSVAHIKIIERDTEISAYEIYKNLSQQFTPINQKRIMLVHSVAKHQQAFARRPNPKKSKRRQSQKKQSVDVKISLFII